MKIAGIDIGTTGCKCTVFDERGSYLGDAYRSYPATRTDKDESIDAEGLIKAVFDALSEMAHAYPDISGIGITSFGEAFIYTDADGNPLHRIIIGADAKGRKQCEKLTEKLGTQRIFEITGLHHHESYSIAKMMWVKENNPKAYKLARHALLMEDYVIFRLTGQAVIDYSLASRSMAFDIKNLCWSKEIFDAADIDFSIMSKPVPIGSIAGKLTRNAAELTGLSTDVIVVPAGHDQQAACIGCGVFDGSRAVDGAGTVECLTPVYETLPDGKIMYDGNYCIVPYVVPGTYVTYAYSYNGGALLQWFTKTFSEADREKAKAMGISVHEYYENEYAMSKGQSVMDGDPGNLLLLPHFSGAATPYMDTGSRGAIIGLTMGTNLAALYRACMEGVVYEMYLNYRKLVLSGMKADMLYATGGGAKSHVWMQMKADALGIPLTALETSNAGTVGCAMLVGAALGIFKDLKAAAAHMVKEKETYYPRQQMHEKYEEIYKRYEKIYEAVRPLV